MSSAQGTGDDGVKILQIIDSSEIAGGERYLVDLARLSGAAFEHYVVLSYPGPLESVLKSLGIEYAIVPMESKLSVASVGKLSRIIQSRHIDIVHTHGYRANFYGRLGILFSKAKHIATVHVSLYDYLDTPTWMRWVYLRTERVLSFKTSKYVCISEAMKRDMLKLGIAYEKIDVVHNGVDLTTFYPREAQKSLLQELGIRQNRPIIGTAGRMVSEKGQIHLIEALVQLKHKWPELCCLFMGTGPLLEQLESHAEKIGVLPMCVFTGVRLDIANIYALLDIFVLPSLREPFGLVLLEAMASRIPVIAMNSGGPPDFIQNGYNGILVPPAHPEEMASRIDFLLTHRDKAAEIAQHGYETAKTRYSVEETIKHVEEIYRECI